MKIFKFALVASALLLCLILSSCFGESNNDPKVSPIVDPIVPADNDPDLQNTDYNILFIGNSLTYSNDLPGLVRNLGEKNGLEIGVKSVVKGNYALIDHWNDGVIQQEIATAQYDFVVVQQGPSSQAFGREVLIEYGKKIKELCDEYGGELAYYMVWPSRTYYHTFDGVIKNHEDAASLNEALLCPVGRVWKKHFDDTNDFSYYGSDGFHPSLKGSQVAADVIYNTLF
ncbi:MAG: SGNH/GDSL hydrolase family protein [Reichenbachiella sp.]|uniref:SGNH/GDSL hydrolase family protein n=1 Tax=Reichenbachiella sp. TaxID=2184521 RepID=UPI003297171F